jgi:hypothetical protein
VIGVVVLTLVLFAVGLKLGSGISSVILIGLSIIAYLLAWLQKIRTL